MDHLARGLQIRALAEIVAAEPDRGHAKAGGAEIANFHGRSCQREQPLIVTIVRRSSKARAALLPC
ncbi:hypothetical protein ABH978_002498 [Bradyrhizobium ottawaense]